MKEAEELLEKYRAGLCTAEEVQLLQKWFHHIGEDEVSELTAEDLAVAKLKFERNVRGLMLPERSYKLWPRIAAVAAAVALIVLGVYFFNHPAAILDSVQDPGLTMNDITPGKNGATITLSSGKVIQLSDAKSGVVIGDGKIAYSDGEILRDALGSKFTASTTKGQTYEFTLPDGTRVWLNADSRISFPSRFSGKERKILLVGEAYFEVARDKKHPFIVESDGQQVEVLGTHFNINAYAEEGSVKTTLLEGSVKVSYLSYRRDDVILKPNQQATMTSRKIDVKTIDPKEAMAWKDGYFRFNDEKIESIMRKVSRWYNVEVEYRGEITKEGFNGAITRYSNIEDVLEIMEGSKAVQFKIEGRRIIVSK